MKYHKTFNFNKSLYPEIIHRFDEIPSEYLYLNHKSFNLRHPGATFNISFDEIISKILKLQNMLKTIDNVDFNKIEESIFKDILEVQTQLINSLNSFYDECYLILISFCKPSQNNPKFASEWLKSNGYDIGDQFKSNVSHSFQRYIEMNNRLKHNCQRLLSVQARSNYGIINGYFLDGMVKPNICGPDPQVHKEFKSVSTCDSFEFVINEMILIVYNAADKLLKIIEKYLKNEYHYVFKSLKFKKHNDSLRSVWDNLANSKYLYFPHEISHKYPCFIKKYNLYSLICPTTLKKIDLNSFSFSMTSTNIYDGYTNSWVMPYFKC